MPNMSKLEKLTMKEQKIYSAHDLVEMEKHFKRVKDPAGAEWFQSTAGENFFFYPYPFPKLLFRGQTSLYKPCLPSISRSIKKYTDCIGDMEIEDQANVILRIAKSHWFAQDIESHPAIKWARNENIFIDRIGLAQHYELETGYIDLSHDFEVAAFFATCEFDNGHWKPKEDGIGVLYKYDLDIGQKTRFNAEPVSLQPFARPRKQSAWLLEVPFGQQFEDHPATSWILFKHDRKISNYFLDKFRNGEILFPDDPLDRVAKKIGNSDYIHESAIDNIISQWIDIEGGITDSKKVKQIIGELIYLGEKRNNLMLNEDLESIRLNWESEKDEVGSKVTSRAFALQIFPPKK